MTLNQNIKNLRDRKRITFFNSNSKVFTRFSLNHKESKICWKREVSKDRKTWILYNDFLSLKDVVSIIETKKFS